MNFHFHLLNIKELQMANNSILFFFFLSYFLATYFLFVKRMLYFVSEKQDQSSH